MITIFFFCRMSTFPVDQADHVNTNEQKRQLIRHRFDVRRSTLTGDQSDYVNTYKQKKCTVHSTKRDESKMC